MRARLSPRTARSPAAGARRSARWSWSLVAWLWAAPAARAGDASGAVALDSLHASSTSSEPASGPEERLSAHEIGLRIRGDLHEVDDRLALAVDYQGREPVAGNLSNAVRRLLFEASVRYELVEDRLVLGAGRFVAPAVVFLPMDGALAELRFDPHTTVTVYGGRRGITTSRANVPFDELLPVAGLAFARSSRDLQLSLRLGTARDLLDLGMTPTEFDCLNGMASAVLVPDPDWVVGGDLAFLQQAAYLVGPTWEDVTVEGVTGLFTALLWGSWRPTDRVHLDADVHDQEVQVFGRGLAESSEPGSDATSPATTSLVEPRHTDLRLRGGLSPAETTWIRPEVRLRLRPDPSSVEGDARRAEVRAGGGVEAGDLGIPALYAEGRLYADAISGGTDDVAAFDRALWSVSLGAREKGLDVEAGASFIERAATPMSGRVATLADPSAPRTSDDLSPFVLEAEDILFVRGSYSARSWFAGVDAERGFADGELRAMFQIGALARGGW